MAIKLASAATRERSVGRPFAAGTVRSTGFGAKVGGETRFVVYSRNARGEERTVRVFDDEERAWRYANHLCQPRDEARMRSPLKTPGQQRGPQDEGRPTYHVRIETGSARRARVREQIDEIRRSRKA